MAEESVGSSTITCRATHAAWWSALEIAVRYGVQLLVMVILARLLTPGDFGLIAMLLVFTVIATLLVGGGFGAALVRQQRRSEDDEITVFLSSFGVSIAVGVLLWFVAPLIAIFYSQPALTKLMRLVLFTLPLGALASVPDALLTQRLDFRSRTNAEIVASLGSGILAVVLAWQGFGVWSLAWQSVVAIALRALLLWRYSGWRPRGRFRAESFRRLFSFGGYLLLSNLLAALHVRLQSLLIGRMFDSRVLGHYTMAQNTQQAPVQVMGGLLNRVGLPVFSMVADQQDKLVGALRLSLRVAMFVFVPCMVGIAVVAKPLVVMLYGDSWLPTAPLLSILAISAALWPMQVLNMVAIGAQGRSDLVFRLELVKSAASVGLLLACSPFGVMAIAWAVLASSLVAVAINTWYTRSLLGYGFLAQLRDQGSTLMLSAVAGFIGWLALQLMPTGPLPMLAAITASAFAYSGGGMLIRGSAFADIINLIRTLRSRDASPP